MAHRFPVLLAAAVILSAGVAQAAEEMASPVTLAGYYRVRGNYFTDPDLDPRTPPATERYFQHRLRLEPYVRLNEYVRFIARVDALDDQVFGANTGNILTQSTADRTANIIVKHAYGEVNLPFGLVKAGRMPSGWARGMISNAGDDVSNEFGDAHGGDTYDRIMFLTRPLGVSSPFLTGVVLDKLIESQYAGAPADKVRIGDANQAGLILNYSTKPFRIGIYSVYRWQGKTESSLFIPDFYTRITREQFHFDAEIGGIFGKTQAITAFYQPGQVVEDKNGVNRKIASLTLDQPHAKVNQKGYAGEIGYKPVKNLDLALESGYASGDLPSTEAFNDRTFSAFNFNSDYSVGLLMFPVANRIRTEREYADVLKTFNTSVGGSTLTELCTKLCVNTSAFPDTQKAIASFLDLTSANFVPSKGAVRNAIYLFPKVRYNPRTDVKLIAGFLWAVAPEAEPTRLANPAATGVVKYQTATDYGSEADVSAEYIAGQFHFGLQGGAFFPGQIFQRANGTKAPVMYTVQPRFKVFF